MTGEQIRSAIGWLGLPEGLPQSSVGVPAKRVGFANHRHPYAVLRFGRSQ